MAISVRASAGGPPAPPPNIVFVLADQWRAAATGYAGDPNVKTPNLDRFAASSVNFTHAVSGCPVCSPCRASLLTGQRPVTHGVFLNDAHLSDDAVTMAEVFRDIGYDTAIIGKWHVNGGGRASYIPPELRQGFEYWRVLECTHDYNHSFYFSDGPERRVWDGYDAFAQTADAQRYIRERAGGKKPFLLCLWWGPPHNPYNTAPEEYRKLYEPGKMQLRPNVPAALAERTRKELAGYYAHCTALDHAFGDLWQTLRDAGIEENTILIFSADHGDMLGSHGMERKQKPWDESLRVPMLWHCPPAGGTRGVALNNTGVKLDAVMSSEDVLPTMLGVIGHTAPKTVEGLDYSGYMAGGPSPNPENAALISCVVPFGEWNRLVGGREYRGLRTPRYTYVRDLKGPWLFYDNEQDPWQAKNLVGDSSNAEMQAKLDAMLNARLKAAHDEFLPSHDYLVKWHYADRVDAKETLPTRP